MIQMDEVNTEADLVNLSDEAYEELQSPILTDEELGSPEHNPQLNLVKLYYKEIRRYKILSPEEIQDLCKRYQETGDIEARDLALTHNLKLVANIATHYLGRGLDFLDLVQEGSIGLLTAVKKYQKEGHDAKFSTYAYYWIKQAIGRALDSQKSTTRPPEYIQNLWGKIQKCRTELFKELGRMPTAQEIVDRSGLSIYTVRKGLMQMFVQTISLEDPASMQSDGKFTIAHFLPDKSTLTPEQLINALDEFELAKIKVKNMFDSLKTFSQRDQEIFAQRFGLDGTLKRKTLEVLGQTYGVTRERIRQIERKMVHKLCIKGIIKNSSCIENEVEKIKSLIDIIGKSNKNEREEILF